jgi:hypothetical protein
MSEFWARRLESAFGLEKRLEKFEAKSVISFAAGCAEHVTRHFESIFKSANQISDAINRFNKTWDDGLRECWTAVSSQPRSNKITEIKKTFDDILGSESFLDTGNLKGAENIDQITGAVYKALECAMNFGDVGFAMGAAHCGYESVFQWYVMRQGETVEWTEDISLDAQSRCMQCAAEIEFQKLYVEILESKTLQPPLYSAVLKSMEKIQ